MIRALVWGRGQFEIAVGEGEAAGKVTVSGWVDHARLWGIHRMDEFYIVTHLPSGELAVWRRRR
jgi:hypothetical protein